MQARGFLNYRLKSCCPQVIFCIVYVNQTNLNGKLRKKLVGSYKGPTKNMGVHGPPIPPLESQLALVFDTVLTTCT